MSSNFLREEVVFGPIKSRRLGNSLGINLLPTQGKICNFDCIYCECGWNRDGRLDRRLPSATEVRNALEAKLIELVREGIRVDSITFSGDGEPTLNPEFPQIIEDTLTLRERYLPGCAVSVLSNSTRAHVPEVFEALRRVDRAIMKLDAPTDALAALINKPAPDYSVSRVVKALSAFQGEFVLQTMFLRSPDFDSSSPEVLIPWMQIVRELRPRLIMAYTIARPTPQAGLEKFSADQIQQLLQPLASEGFCIQINA